MLGGQPFYCNSFVSPIVVPRVFFWKSAFVFHARVSVCFGAFPVQFFTHKHMRIPMATITFRPCKRRRWRTQLLLRIHPTLKSPLGRWRQCHTDLRYTRFHVYNTIAHHFHVSNLYLTLIPFFGRFSRLPLDSLLITFELNSDNDETNVEKVSFLLNFCHVKYSGSWELTNLCVQ